MTIDLYLAGASSELDRILPLVQVIDGIRGVRLVRRWWELVLKHGGGNPPELTHETRFEYASQDLAAVAESDVLWLLYPDRPSVGAFIELGAALCDDKPVIITGRRAHESIFSSMAETVHEEDLRGLQWLQIMTRADRLPRAR
jgi:hypothetical protein